MKKLSILLGITALMGLVLWANPVSAAHSEDTADRTVTLETESVPGTVGDATVTISGTGYAGVGVYIIACPGAEGDADTVTAATGAAFCPGIVGVVFTGTPGLTVADDGSWSFDYTFPVIQTDIDAGAMVITVGQAADLAGTFAERVLVTIEAAPDAPAPATPTTTPPSENLARTGVESGLIAISGVSVILAGLLFAGIGRRLRKNS